MQELDNHAVALMYGLASGGATGQVVAAAASALWRCMKAGHGFSDKDKDSDSDKQGGGLGCHRLREQVQAKVTAVEEFFI